MNSSDLKTWGCYTLCDRIFKDILNNLKEFYSDSDALRIYIMAILRVCRPGISDDELEEEYDESWLSVLYPDADLSKSTVSTFQKDLGRTCSIILAFMKKRCSSFPDDHDLIIAGTVKTDDSARYDYSVWPRKKRFKKRRDISVLYASDLESLEPVCSLCFPGNMIDSKTYEQFLDICQIGKGIVAGNREFEIEQIRDCFFGKPDLHYLNPVQRNSDFPDIDHADSSSGKLSLQHNSENEKRTVYYKKTKTVTESGHAAWLYSFKDVCRAIMEEEAWADAYTNRGLEKEKDISFEELRRQKSPAFGTILMESDLDLPPEEIYRIYEARNDAEIMVQFYKSDLAFDPDAVNADYLIIGAEFIDFLAVLLTCRLEELFQKSSDLAKLPYPKIMDDLHKIRMIRCNGSNWELVKPTKRLAQIMQETGLDKKPELKKRGRPKTNPDPNPNQPKRKPGRPRVRPLPDPDMPKRKPGRPKGSKNKEKKTPSDAKAAI